MNREIATFEAKCGKCKKTFSHPSLGDFSYGEKILYSLNGKHQAWVSALAGFPEKVANALPKERDKEFWKVLAALADPVDGLGMTDRMVCPHCAATELAYWEGNRIGTASIPEATFSGFSHFPDAALKEKIAAGFDSLA